MYRISKQFRFEAAHHLEGLPADHPCSRKHGHSYLVIITLESERLDNVGFVVDYRKLDAFKKLIDRDYDHRDLNDIVPFNPTAENLAGHFFSLATQSFPGLISCTVKETEKTSATYELGN